MRGSGTTLATASPNEVEVLGSPGELVNLSGQPTALEAVTRAEIDTQIATAKRFPRSPARFLSEARSMVAVDPELAAQCTYRLPARKGGNGQPITGPSVRLAEIAAVCWGNLRVVGRISEDDGRAVTAQGVCIDLERNVGYSVEVRRNVLTKDGRRFGEDMVNVTCNAAIALATRNATFKAIPRAFVNLVEEAAQAVARGDVASMPERTGKALEWFATRGVTQAEVFRTLGINGPADMTLDHLTALQGFRTAINEGVSTVDEIFRPEPPEAIGAKKKGAEGLADRLPSKPKAEATPKPADPRAAFDQWLDDQCEAVDLEPIDVLRIVHDAAIQAGAISPTTDRSDVAQLAALARSYWADDPDGAAAAVAAAAGDPPPADA